MFRSDGNQRSWIKNKYRHDLLFNCSEENLFEGTNRTFSRVHVELPYPILAPGKEDKDNVKSLLEEKQAYLDRFRSERRRFKNTKKCIFKKRVGNQQYMYLPKRLLELYSQIDPDVTFNCDYNYYYTGGNLDHLQMYNCDFLVYADAENNVKLFNVSEVENTPLLHYKTETPIHSLNCVKESVVIREKTKVSVIGIDEPNSSNLKWQYDFKIPIFDAKLNISKPSHLGVVLHTKTFKIKDIETDQLYFQYKPDTEDNIDNFQQLRFLNSDTVMIMDRFTVKTFDYRTKDQQNTFECTLVKCNPLCDFQILNNNMYLLSRHYILKTDIRYFKNFTHYSHSLGTTPCYLDLAVKNDDTYLCAASQSPSDVILFTGKSPYTLPFKVPSIKSNLDECRLVYPKLVFRMGLDKRVMYSRAGMKIVNLNDEIIIFWINSLGEIFKQKVSDHPVNTQEPVKILHDWINKIEQPPPVLHLTEYEDASHVFFALHKPPILGNLKQYTCKGKGEEFLAKFAATYQKENVTSQSAKDFISIWDDSDEDSDESDNEIKKSPQADSTEKVDGWLQDQEFDIGDISEFLNFTSS